MGLGARAAATSAYIYKVCGSAEWQSACVAGQYTGSADDKRDGFIHLSTAAQLAGTLERHFAGRADLVLVAFDPAKFGDTLKWEASRNGALFPHVYCALPTAGALSVEVLPLGANGRHTLRTDLS